MNPDHPLVTARTSSFSPLVDADPKRDRGYGYLTGPLRRRGLEVTVEYGLSGYVVDVALPDGSSMIISPPQEPPSENPDFPENWTVIRHRETGPPVYEVVYDSEPDGPDARHGGSVSSLLAAVDTCLDQLGVPPRRKQYRSSQEHAADPVPPRMSAALSPSPSAGSRTVRTPLAAESPPRSVLPSSRSSTAPGR